MQKLDLLRGCRALIVILSVLSIVYAEEDVDISRHKRDYDWFEGEQLDRCQKCPPGQGVVSLCNSTENTVCGPCPTGTFSSGFTINQTCTACKSCPAAYYEYRHCNPVRDVDCIPCTREVRGGFGNEDFLRKCEHTTTRKRVNITTKVIGKIPEITKSATLLPVAKTTTSESPADPEEEVEESPEPEEEGRDASGDVDEIIPSEEPTPKKTDRMATDELLPVRTKPPLTTTTQLPDIEEHTSVVAGNASILAQVEETELVQGGFQWPILVAAILAAVVFFIVGMVISIIVKKRRGKKNSQRLDYEDGAVATTMISEEDERKHMNETENSPIYTGTRRYPKKRGKGRRRRRWYNAEEMRYIDEDSDDEIVQHVGRPPSIRYKDEKKRRGLIDRLRKGVARKSSSGSDIVPPSKKVEKDEPVYSIVSK